MATKKITLKLMIHKEKNQIVYAESGNDFVDVLLSFLTMPLGTVIRLTGKQSEMGSLNNLFGSVEDLDVQYLQTESCKNMLLYPKSASEEHCRNLIVNIDDTEPTNYYLCIDGNYSSFGRSSSRDYKHLISSFPDKKCCCGRSVERTIPREKSKNAGGDGKDGVFVKGKMRYMITDDLQVLPACMRTSLELLKRFGISDASVLEERTVNLGQEKVLHLLNSSLLSKTPLTDVFLPMQHTKDEVTLGLKVIELDSKDMAYSHTETEIGSNRRKMSVNLFVSKSRNKVLYAQVGEEFPDLLFSFLAFPLGSIVNCLGGCTSMGCLDDLYKSIKELNKRWMKSEETKPLLLDPKLAPYFGSTNQLIQINELPGKITTFDCSSCFANGIGVTDSGFGACSHGCGKIQVEAINPKFRGVVTELGGAFMAGPGMFMVTEELIVKPLSTISGISFLSQFNIPISDLEEQVVSVGEEEVKSSNIPTRFGIFSGYRVEMMGATVGQYCLSEGTYRAEKGLLGIILRTIHYENE